MKKQAKELIGAYQALMAPCVVVRVPQGPEIEALRPFCPTLFDAAWCLGVSSDYPKAKAEYLLLCQELEVDPSILVHDILK